MRMMNEEDHGLGIDRAVQAKEVESLEGAMWQAAAYAISLGVDFNRAAELLESAMDERLYETLEEMDEATHDAPRRRLGTRGRSHRYLVGRGLHR